MSRIKRTRANLHMILCTTLVVFEVLSAIAIPLKIKPYIMVSEAMDSEVPKNSLVLIDTHIGIEGIERDQNAAYLLGKVKAVHKVVDIRKDESE